VGAAQDVKLSECDSTKTGTTFAGTVANPTAATQSYRIYVAVTDKSATVGVAEVEVPALAAKATSPWKGNVDSGAEGAKCVLRVERTQQA